MSSKDGDTFYTADVVQRFRDVDSRLFLWYLFGLSFTGPTKRLFQGAIGASHTQQTLKFAQIY